MQFAARYGRRNAKKLCRLGGNYPKNAVESRLAAFCNRAQYGQILYICQAAYYPDGGVARLKVYGEVFTDWSKYDASTELDLASANLGAKSVLCNDMFFSHMSNLIMPFRGANMGDGWETKRNRTPNNRDWVVVKLAHVGEIRRVLIDTCHFKGNYPDTFSLDGINLPEGSEITADNVHNLAWVEVLGKQKLQADFEHYYNDLPKMQAFTHVRLNIFPDGGVSRMRLWGNISK